MITSLYLSPKVLEEKNRTRFERYRLVQEREADFEAYCMEDAEVCLVAYGISGGYRKVRSRWHALRAFARG